MGKEMEKEKNINLVNQNFNGNIQMGKEMEREENIILMEN